MDGSSKSGLKTELIQRVFETMEYGPAPESDAPAMQWLEAHGKKLGHFIDGKFVEPSEGKYFPTINPGRNTELAHVAQGSPKDVDDAVKAATKALPGWQKLGAHGRARYLYAIARHIQKHSRLFSVLETLDNGKPIRESRDVDIPLVARHFYHHAGWAQLMEKELPGYAPIGVVGQIIPWNFPLLMLSWKIAPALAMGNTLVLKPAEFTPLTALLFAEICAEVGLPKGVVNVVNGDGRTGAALVGHDGVGKIAFTGSTEVGKIIREATAGSGKKLSLELGGKSPFVVYEDADLDSVVEGVVDAIWFNQGQVCCAGSRILAQESIAETLLAKLRVRMESLRIGDPLDKCIDIGAVVAPVQLTRIEDLVAQGVKEGAKKWQPDSWVCPKQGFYHPPTILSEVSPAATVAQVEIFGPVVVFMTFRTPEESVALANNTVFGLASSVWTENINLALDIAPKIKAGTVWINCTNHFDAAAGFGGYRESGYGREGGREGLFEYAVPAWMKKAAHTKASKKASKPSPLPVPAAGETEGLPQIDRTAKLYVGGKQARPDEGYSLPVLDPKGRVIDQVAKANRKDVRNAVEAAQGAGKWGGTTGHARAQVLYFLAENMEAREAEFTARVAAMTGNKREAAREVRASIERVFTYAAWADKYDGLVHATNYRNVTVAMNEPIGVIGIVCGDELPLLQLISLVAPAVAMGNTVVVVPSERHPLAATDLYQILDTSDVPAGVINILTGVSSELAPVLAAHDAVDAVWYFGAPEGEAAVERASAGNMKRTFTAHGIARDWLSPEQGEGREMLREATQVKNIWVPYGEMIAKESSY